MLDNYEEARGVSLPRSTVYSHYHQHCAAENIEPMNAASFGKLIRSVFPNIQTRRLGTRYVNLGCLRSIPVMCLLWKLSQLMCHAMLNTQYIANFDLFIESCCLFNAE